MQKYLMSCSSTRSFGKARKEIKPIIIDDIPTIIGLNNKTGLDTKSQGDIVMRILNNLVRPGTRGATYPDPIARPPPKPPELKDETTGLRQDTDANPNVDIKENSPH